MSEKRKTLDKLFSSKELREAFVAAKVTVGLPFQIRALRLQRGWSQSVLAEKAGMKQPRISAMERPGYKGFALETLMRLASAFDVALQVRYASFGELIDFSEEFSPDTFALPSFPQEYISFSHANQTILSASTTAQQAVKYGGDQPGSAASAVMWRDRTTANSIPLLGSYFTSGHAKPVSSAVSAAQMMEGA